MQVLLLLSAAVVAAGQQTNTPPHDAEVHKSNELLHKSLVSSLLLATGFSETCVAAALDTCGQPSMQHQPPPPKSLVQVIAYNIKVVLIVIRKLNSVPILNQTKQSQLKTVPKPREVTKLNPTLDNRVKDLYFIISRTNKLLKVIDQLIP